MPILYANVILQLMNISNVYTGSNSYSEHFDFNVS